MKFIAVTENKRRFAWETRVYLTSLREHNYSPLAQILVFLSNPEKLPVWQKLEEDFPEVSFFYFKDKGISEIGRRFGYPPIHRLYCLQEHWKANKDLEKEVIFYTDTDIIFTKKLDFTPFLKDNINYLSWTGNIIRTDNYLGLPYLEGKINQVLPEKLEQYKKLDVPARLAFICGISKDTLEKNIENTGGAQYLLKNISAQFWTDCFNTCCEIKLYLAGINQNFMKGSTPQEKEDNGFQSWCADMWAVLYNLWKTSETRAPKELDFAWSTDLISRADEVFLLHNAGITSDEKIKLANTDDGKGGRMEADVPVFYKAKKLYEVIDPWNDLTLLTMYNNPLNKQFCNNLYLSYILKCRK